eukprot:TRINITY_DN74604_c0_g1_i1.p1 TRINITY_DN74604_c0_g1~~TRINITY_DN74604_c0_g1_i1.p1  ORF type:complete len:407 (+),score=78.49 TRINITY_DN74604_c0_g1_i1:115-1335(+)
MVSDAPAYYLLDLKAVPEEVWTCRSTASQWFEGCASAGKEGFPANSLGRRSLPSCPAWMQAERCLAYVIYNVAFNIVPFSTPLVLLLRLVKPYPKLRHLLGLAALQVLLVLVYPGQWRKLLRLLRGGRRSTAKAVAAGDAGPASKAFVKQQLDVNFEMERHNHYYFGTKWILPRSIVERQDSMAPSILCMTPHGLLPFGTSACVSKVFGGRATQWAAAPILFKLPGGARHLLRSLGCFPAGKSGILQCLEEGDHAGVILDGIPGMFCNAKPGGDQELWLLQRKAIVAIALQAGAPIVPAYCFGTTDCCKIVDPLFGLLKHLSTQLDISLTPFLGRWWLPFGPPARVPLLMCFGDPIDCPKLPEGLPKAQVQAAVERKHAELLEAYTEIFNTHKAAYGCPEAKLSFV